MSRREEYEMKTEALITDVYKRQVLNNDGNVIMTEGLVLQDKNIWKDFLEKDVVPQNNMTELYLSIIHI